MLACAQQRAAREQQSQSQSQPKLPATASCPGAALQIGPDYVDFDRPLSVNVSTSYNPEIHTWASHTRTEVGIEKLTIECPWTAYAGMNREQGWNALNFWWTPHSWVDDVSILNAGVAPVAAALPERWLGAVVALRCAIPYGMHAALCLGGLLKAWCSWRV